MHFLKQDELGSTEGLRDLHKMDHLKDQPEIVNVDPEPGNPFDNFFNGNTHFSRDNKILGTRQLKKLEQVRATHEGGVYTFHQALDYKSGPEIQESASGKTSSMQNG